jgi:S-adenosylmethionine-diacylglycerol 3-amino-3-carboxypropyl transferase
VVNRPKFAVVREDPDVEFQVCARVSARSVLLVASGGCTALTLAHRSPGLQITAFDFNPAQLEHVREKRDAVARGDLRALNVGDDATAGLNQRGEFEGLFRVLRGVLVEFVAPRGELASFFDEATTRDARSALVERWRTSRYWPVAFELAFHDSLLHAMFGPAATQHAERGSYPGYFQRAFERGLLREDAVRNPFLRHVLVGCYDEANAPDYVRAGRAIDLELILGSLVSVPELARFDVISLSNVFDWSDDALVTEWATALRRHAHPGSAVILRQLNNRRDLRRFFGEDFSFDDTLGAELTARDRSLFYERIEVGLRR